MKLRRTAGCLAWIAFGGCLTVGALWAQGLQVLELQHRSAQGVIPVLRPLLERR
jgi:hypothetical protein